ncbi:MAG: cytochrome P450 [Beutenbergiaceae bacterium]
MSESPGSEHYPHEVDPAGRDLRAYTDQLRADHDVVHNVLDEWVLLRHRDVVAAATDPVTFSSAVSRYLQVPNGLDGLEHAAMRAALDPFMSAEALAPLRQPLAQAAQELLRSLPEAVDAIDVGTRFAVRAQSLWLGWPAELEPQLVAWVARNHDAARSPQHADRVAVAAEFDAIIATLISQRREGEAPADVTTALLRTDVGGRALTDAEVTSILRNWTGGDLGSIALCVGVIAHGLATDPGLQSRLRSGVSDAEFDAVIDELLRADDPFISNRRVTTCPVSIGGVDIPAGAKVKLHWTSANRDGDVHGDPDAIDAERDPGLNLVYGIGPHACPGRELATMELRIAVAALVDAATFELDPRNPPVREVAPVGGWASVPLLLHKGLAEGRNR